MKFSFDIDNPLILDGGMGQALIEKGLQTIGTIWSATALLDQSLHKLVIETHHDFINAGAKVIVTNNFAVRKLRFSENHILDKFEKAMHTAGKLAKHARDTCSNKSEIIIAGSLPTRHQTYLSKFERSKDDTYQELYDSANILKDYVDIFYLDVMSSINEIHIALEACSSFNKKILIGTHVNKDGLIPDGNKITQLSDIITKYDVLGVIAACSEQQPIFKSLDSLKELNVPFGFKVNAWAHMPDGWLPIPGNPTNSFGKDKDFNNERFINFSKECTNRGASILGGCCQVTPDHIKALVKEYKN